MSFEKSKPEQSPVPLQEESAGVRRARSRLAYERGELASSIREKRQERDALRTKSVELSGEAKELEVQSHRLGPKLKDVVGLPGGSGELASKAQDRFAEAGAHTLEADRLNVEAKGLLKEKVGRLAPVEKKLAEELLSGKLEKVRNISRGISIDGMSIDTLLEQLGLKRDLVCECFFEAGNTNHFQIMLSSVEDIPGMRNSELLSLFYNFIFDVCTEQLEGHLPHFNQQDFREDVPDGYVALFRNISHLFDRGTVDQIASIRDVYRGGTSVIDIFVTTSSAGRAKLAPYFYMFLSRDNREIEASITNLVARFSKIESKEDFKAIISLVATVLDKCNGSDCVYLRLHYERLMVSLLKNFQLNEQQARQMCSFWTYGEHFTHYTRVSSNLNKMFDLESRVSGGVKFLFENNGIADFGRYPIELLVDQIDSHDKNDLPYGIFVDAIADSNGALARQEINYDILQHRLKGKCYIRLFQSGSSVDLARHLASLVLKYGRKISFGIMNAHGQEDGMRLGYFYVDDGPPLLLSGQVKSLPPQKLRRLFVPNPSLVLIACSTGAVGGIGQRLSETLAARVVAPEEPCDGVAIEPSFDGDSISFHVEFRGYSQKPGAHNEQIATRRYVSGSLVS